METQKIILAPSSRASHPINIDIDGKVLHKRRNIKDIPTTAVPAKSSTTTTTAVAEHGTKPIYIRQHHHHVKSKRSNSWQHQHQQQHQVHQQQQQTRWQFHQHFASSCFIQKCFLKLFLITVWLCNF